MTAPLLVIAAGGTGGHMFPAQALAEEMLARGWRVRLSTDKRGKRYTEGFPDAVEVVETFAATMARGKLVDRLMVPFILLAGVVWEVFGMLRERPSVVVGFGGYPSIPALLAAWILRIPRMVHEQNGVLGRVNAVLARRVDRVACGTWPTALPKGVTAVHTGNPVRAAVRKRAGAPFIPPGDYPMSILVFGGSQGARVISEKIPAVLAELSPRLRGYLRVSHQARPEDAEAVAAAYRAAGIEAEIKPFFDDIARRMAEAQMVICRAGASSVADLTVIGRPSVLVPFAAAAADHQTANARPLAEAGAALMIPEAALDEGLAVQIAELLTHPKLALKMSLAALKLGKPDAAEALAALVEELSGKGET